MSLLNGRPTSWLAATLVLVLLPLLEDGRDLETTMGLTPLDGLIISTLVAALLTQLLSSISLALVVIPSMIGHYDEQAAPGSSHLSGHLDSWYWEDAHAGDIGLLLALDMFPYRPAHYGDGLAMHGFDTMAFCWWELWWDVLALSKELEWMGVKIDEESTEVRPAKLWHLWLQISKVRPGCTYQRGVWLLLTFRSFWASFTYNPKFINSRILCGSFLWRYR